MKNISSRNLNTQTLLSLVPTTRLVVLWLSNCVTPTDFRDIRPSLAHSLKNEKMSALLMILLLFSMLGCSEGATIVMLPAIGKSHFLVFERVAEELTDRGYEV